MVKLKSKPTLFQRLDSSEGGITRSTPAGSARAKDESMAGIACPLAGTATLKSTEEMKKWQDLHFILA